VNNAFGYNLKSEVTSATMANGDSKYNYDPIGNRVFSSLNALTNTYSANALNQYSSINPLNPVNPVEKIIPSFDFDGNMITNGDWSYTWDAENRMISACSNGLLLITNRYDDQSRRIRKSVFEITQSGTNEIRQSSFVYDGWNPIREIRVQESGVSTIYYCWGPDLSGSLQGAGGVGGLQAVIVDGETPATYYPCYDANGNITAYVDELGFARAEYAYDAFGQTISQSGDLASTFSHRFSTKYADDETGLYYYGYRYYSPELGRWVNRDPIEEEGGVNLYGFVGNGGVSFFDLLGLDSWKNLLAGGEWGMIKGKVGNLKPTADVEQYEGVTVLRTRGGLGTAIYKGNNAPPATEKEMSNDCRAMEIEFQYKFIAGVNSGFYFSIPTDASTQELIDANGLEMQILSSKADTGYQKNLMKAQNHLTSSTATEDLKNRAKDMIKDIQLHWQTGGIYGRKGRNADGVPELNAAWNAVRVQLGRADDGKGLKITIWINGKKVNDFVTTDGVRGYGRIGFQAHDQEADTVFKGIQWRWIDENK
jgi:RHS repeat-associated protein